MFIALFIIAPNRKQPKCLPVDDWINKMWYIHTMEYYSARKNKEILPFVTTWMDLEGIMLSEITQKEKYCMISLICGFLKKRKQTNKTHQTHRKRDQTCGYQMQRIWGEELEEGGQKVQTSRYKINKY